MNPKNEKRMIELSGKTIDHIEKLKAMKAVFEELALAERMELGAVQVEELTRATDPVHWLERSLHMAEAGKLRTRQRELAEKYRTELYWVRRGIEEAIGVSLDSVYLDHLYR